MHQSLSCLSQVTPTYQGLNFKQFLDFYCFIMGQYKKMKRSQHKEQSSEAHETKVTVLQVGAADASRARRDSKTKKSPTRKRRSKRHKSSPRKSDASADGEPSRKKRHRHHRKKGKKHKHHDRHHEVLEQIAGVHTTEQTSAAVESKSAQPKIARRTSLAGLPTIPDRHKTRQEESGDMTGMVISRQTNYL